MRCDSRSKSRQKRLGTWIGIALVVALALFWSHNLKAGDNQQLKLEATPDRLVLDGPESTWQILTNLRAEGRVAFEDSVLDVTRQATYQPLNPGVIRISREGLVEPLLEGQTEILVRHQGRETRIKVEVRGLKQPMPVSFEQQVIPVLTKSGCNAGSCHGKAEGQNGFKLSVFGFDPVADHEALAMEGRGRRVFPSAPEHSLFLLKGTAKLPHGGGKKIDPDGLAYRRMKRWVSEGCQYRTESMAPIVKIEIEPAQHFLKPKGQAQARVIALDSQGKRFCVTAEAEYESNAPSIVAVDRRGWIQASELPGEAAILARYLGLVSVCRVTVPRPMAAAFARPPEVNFVDHHVWNQLNRLRIPASDLSDDAMFLRRVYLDVIGLLPTAKETRAFLQDPDPAKRSKLIDALLNRPEYADYWTMKWSDLLRVDRDAVTPQGAVAMTRWLHRQLMENRPYDQFVKDIITARGSITAEGPAGFYKVFEKPDIMSRSVSQLFLGVRIECAQCHHHPSERWAQDDYFAFAGFFTGVARKSPPGSGEFIIAQAGSDMNHPRTGKPALTRALGDEPAVFSPLTDRREVLANWMTKPNNPFLAKAIANRLWAHYFGRGLIEPIDDLRATNPASNEPLLAALEQHLRDVKYDLKAFTKTLLNSRTYQLSSKERPENAGDLQNHSKAPRKSMPAEVLLDAISQVTLSPEKFNGWPLGYRSVQIWDNRVPSYFLKIFGKPARTSVCECERSNEPGIAQALHLMNSPEITAKVRDRRGRARQLADSSLTPQQIIEELYLTLLCRFPKTNETHLMLEAFSDANAEGNSQLNRRLAVEDVLWALINSKEFQDNH